MRFGMHGARHEGHVGKNAARRAAPKLQRGYGRPICWPSDAVRRAATAIREANSPDTFMLASRALEFAIRNEADLIELLPTMKPPFQFSKARIETRDDKVVQPPLS